MDNKQPFQTPPEIVVHQPKPNYFKIIIFSVIGIVLIGVIIFLYLQNQQFRIESMVTNFTECSAVKNSTIRESYPTVCFLPSGKSFTQELTPEEQSQLIPPKETNPESTISPDKTAGWKTLVGNDFIYSNELYSGYSLKYPNSCEVINNINLSCVTSNGKVTIIINAGGHGLPNNLISLRNNEPKTIPAGSGLFSEVEFIENNTVLGVFTINKTDLLSSEPIFMFEFNELPKKDLKEFEKLFDQILSTFKFIDSRSEIPDNINKLFTAVNHAFKSNIVPAKESQFYSPQGFVKKESWKLNISNLLTEKSQFTLLFDTLENNLKQDVNSAADGVGQSVQGYESDQVYCFLLRGFNSSDYISCIEK